jgi:hypothetical protein
MSSNYFNQVRESPLHYQHNMPLTLMERWVNAMLSSPTSTIYNEKNRKTEEEINDSGNKSADNNQSKD